MKINLRLFQVMILLDKIKSLTGNFALSKKQHNGDSRSVGIGPNGDGTEWTKVYYGPNGTNSLRWAKTTYDVANRLIREEKPGFGGTTLTNSYVYNEKGQLTSTTAPGMAPTLYEYDELGSVIKVCLDVDNDGTIDESEMDRIAVSDTYFEQDGSSDWWMVGSNGVYAVENTNTLTTTGYAKIRFTGLSTNLISETKNIDIFGNETISSRSVNRSAKTLTQTTDVPDSTNDAVSIAINGLLVSSEVEIGLEYTYSYDGIGRRSGVTDPRTGTRTTAYSSKGQIASVTDAATNTTSYAYSELTGRNIAVTNALGNATRYEYDAKGLLIHIWGDAMYPEEYSYDNFDQMISMSTYRGGTNWISATWPEGESSDTTQWQYDEATGLLTNKLYADGNGTAYSYTSDGKIETRTWARGITTTYSYTNTTGKMIGIDYSDSTPDVVIAYDRNGRQESVTDAQGTRTFGFNPSTLTLTNETIVAGGETNVIGRTYDSQGRDTGVVLDSENFATYSYSDLGRFGGIIATNVGSQVVNVQYDYLDDSFLLAGWTNSVSGVQMVRAFDAHRDLIASVENRTNNTAFSSFDYVNDALARRTQRVDNSSITNVFEYNTRSELVSAVMGTNQYDFAYDNIGNRQSFTNNDEATTYEMNNLNQYSSITNSSATNSLTYDLDGNLSTYDGWNCEWDGENNLSQITNDTTAITCRYDFMGRRVEKVVNGETNSFLYDNWNLVYETDGTTTIQYTWGIDIGGSMEGAGGIGGLLSVTEITESQTNTYYPAYDGNGNITEYVDENGAMVAHYEYGVFGRIVTSSGDKKDDFHFRFSTKYFDQETGLCYYGYRYYNPVLGRWLSRDPIGERGGVNRYAFIENKSIGTWDYLGLNGCSDVVDDFLRRNKEILLNGLMKDPGLDGYILSWKDTCRFKIECKCCGGTKKGSTGYSPIVEEKDFNTGSETHTAKITTSEITICEDNVKDPRDIEDTVLHELQHAKDNCTDDASVGDCKEKYPGKENEQKELRMACECANDGKMCLELRAHMHDMSGKSKTEVINYLVYESSYWWTGPGAVYCARYKGEGGEASQSKVVKELQDNCDVKSGMIPKESLSWSEKKNP